jgi:lipid II:glycine glycyltransferase (peptidoglycan interpeptide bridge formation enzyme)
MDDSANIKNHLSSSGYQYEEYLNYLIDLSNDEKTTLRSFSMGRKSELKRAERIGYSIEEVKDIKNLLAFCEIMMDAYARIKIPLADLSLFESAYKHLYNTGHIKFFLACYRGSIVGAIALLIFKGMVLTWYYGSYWNESLPSPESLLI